MKEITIEALINNLDEVTDFVDDFLDANDCPMKAKMQINIAVDEIFSNVSHYAYKTPGGEVTVGLEIQDEPRAVCITFTDQGVPYDPLKKEDPDITLTAEDREIGGLGIYMVKKNMDDMQYNYTDGQNRLLMKKYI